MAFGKRGHSECDVRIGERHEKLHDGAVGPPGNMLLCSWLLLPAIKDEPRGEAELTRVQRHPAAPEQPRKRLLGAKVPIEIGYDFILTAVMPPAVTDAESPSSAEHLSGFAVAAYQACGARTVNHVTLDTTLQIPSRVVAASVETKSRSIANEVSWIQSTERLGHRYEPRMGGDHGFDTKFSPNVVRQRGHVECVRVCKPAEESRGSLSREWSHPAGQRIHFHLTTSPMRC
ncbi:hypothetical protein LVJ59_08000 [Microbacterium sp. KKR3/1]|nr:hypothetical protein [Microbacterium sp. KKR3/1]